MQISHSPPASPIKSHKGESQTCWRASHVLAEKRGIKAKSSLLTDYHPFFFLPKCFYFASLGTGMVAPESGRLTVILSGHEKMLTWQIKPCVIAQYALPRETRCQPKPKNLGRSTARMRGKYTKTHRFHRLPYASTPTQYVC
jgi:hypothetical protein